MPSDQTWRNAAGKFALGLSGGLSKVWEEQRQEEKMMQRIALQQKLEYEYALRLAHEKDKADSDAAAAMQGQLSSAAESAVIPTPIEGGFRLNAQGIPEPTPGAPIGSPPNIDREVLQNALLKMGLFKPSDLMQSVSTLQGQRSTSETQDKDRERAQLQFLLGQGVPMAPGGSAESYTGQLPLVKSNIWENMQQGRASGASAAQNQAQTEQIRQKMGLELSDREALARATFLASHLPSEVWATGELGDEPQYVPREGGIDSQEFIKLLGSSGVGSPESYITSAAQAVEREREFNRFAPKEEIKTQNRMSVITFQEAADSIQDLDRAAAKAALARELARYKAGEEPGTMPQQAMLAALRAKAAGTDLTVARTEFVAKQKDYVEARTKTENRLRGLKAADIHSRIGLNREKWALVRNQAEFAYKSMPDKLALLKATAEQARTKADLLPAQMQGELTLLQQNLIRVASEAKFAPEMAEARLEELRARTETIVDRAEAYIAQSEATTEATEQRIEFNKVTREDRIALLKKSLNSASGNSELDQAKVKKLQAEVYRIEMEGPARAATADARLKDIVAKTEALGIRTDLAVERADVQNRYTETRTAESKARTSRMLSEEGPRLEKINADTRLKEQQINSLIAAAQNRETPQEKRLATAGIQLVVKAMGQKKKDQRKTLDEAEQFLTAGGLTAVYNEDTGIIDVIPTTGPGGVFNPGGFAGAFQGTK